MTGSTISNAMTRALVDRGARALKFIWGGWAGLASFALFCAVWQAGFETYGAFILPAPLEVFSTVFGLLHIPETWALALTTAKRAGESFLLAVLVGVTLGVISGHAPAVMRLQKPLLTVLLGVPPVAWIVLAMIWFGGGDGTVIVTVLVAATPIVLVGTAEGILSRDRGLDAMGQLYGAGPIRRFTTLSWRHTLSHLFPSLILALATGFKVAVMAELLANSGGIGGALSDARTNFDIAEALAWVVMSVGLLIGIEYGLIHPFRAELDRWKTAAQPWGVKK
ncbi:ABC transporter permease [Shimia sagamensis]|uniref:NitT/TauT family transport system permease protein n=1 Tax=Shimia sagamensis TaxID=1566352 RepID=A0ABY1PE52_9RHOB|nr:ABC transporter permease [Shimia sagamensis]SMP31057.1 NitT/TauT family transport system permease protein [Shimia sagamensis]